MNRINRNNYEIYLIDLMEGNLDALTQQELMTFLDTNPDIKEEFEKYEEVTLSPDAVLFKEKSKLKHHQITPVGEINEDTFEHFFIAWHEHDLTQKEKQDIEQFIATNPFLKNDFELFGKLTATQNEEVVFNSKALLYHRRKIAPLFWMSSAAAVLLVLIAVFGLLKSNLNRQILSNQTKSVAQVSSIIKNDAAPEKQKSQKTYQNTIVNNDSLNSRHHTADAHHNNRKKVFAVTTSIPVKQNSNITMVTELTSANPNIKLTDDNVYCRFKYKKIVNYILVDKEKKKKNFIGKIIANLFNDAKQKVAPNTPKSNNEPLLARVFDGGAHVLNSYTGTEANVTKYYDNRGKLITYHFSGGQIRFSKKFKSQGR